MRNTERGFVSLLTTIIISLLLMVIVMSMVGLETLQLRKAEDAEQSIRAYYTAEAGVENAVGKVLSGTIADSPTYTPTCSANRNYDIPGDAGWTCQEVSFNGSPTGKLPYPDYATTVMPGNVNYNRMMIQWDETNGPLSYTVPVGNLPDEATYTATYSAPPIELSIVEYPPAGFSQADVGRSVTLENALIVPGGVGANGIGPIYQYNAPSGAPPGHGPYYASCKRNRGTGYLGQPTVYACYMVFKGLNPAKNYLWRIRSRYLPTDYSMTFYQGNTPVPVPTGTAIIDVTAQAGQTYRRVISLLPLGQGAAADLNYVMYSDTDVCKDFNVINNVAQPGCPAF